MSISRSHELLTDILHDLRKLPREAEWVEFKCNNQNPVEIGENISALSNSAALLGKNNAWMLWGIDDATHAVAGTDFDPASAKKSNEELENWLLRLLNPRINFLFHSLAVAGNRVVMLEISPAVRHPTRFQGVGYIRIGSYTKKLKDYSEKERELWRALDQVRFEEKIAAADVADDDVLRLLDYSSYFDLLKLPLPEGKNVILDALARERFIKRVNGGKKWNILNLGAILFAKSLDDFRALARKAVRVIQYKGDSRIDTIREQVATQGYARSFEGLIYYIKTLLPSNEVIGQALREEVPMFPEVAIRELVANAIIHQDLHATGASPMIELFATRMEITNPGSPLVRVDRFLDSPPNSRNEALAAFMRRIGVCEERGSGVDKVVFQTEIFQLPAPLFEVSGNQYTRAVLFAHRKFKDMDKSDRLRACYLHACLKYVNRENMTNSTLRERLGIEPGNSAIVSRIIADSIAARSILCHDDSAGPRARRYIPWWARAERNDV